MSSEAIIRMTATTTRTMATIAIADSPDLSSVNKIYMSSVNIPHRISVSYPSSRCDSCVNYSLTELVFLTYALTGGSLFLGI